MIVLLKIVILLIIILIIILKYHIVLVKLEDMIAPKLVWEEESFHKEEVEFILSHKYIFNNLEEIFMHKLKPKGESMLSLLQGDFMLNHHKPEFMLNHHKLEFTHSHHLVVFIKNLNNLSQV